MTPPKKIDNTKIIFQNLINKNDNKNKINLENKKQKNMKQMKVKQKYLK